MSDINSLPPRLGFPSAEQMERNRAALTECRATTQDYFKAAVTPDEFGLKAGHFNVASILAWTRIAKFAGVRYIPAKELACIPIEDAWLSIDGREGSEESVESFKRVIAYASAGGYWRTDLCASEDVKCELARGNPLPDKIPFHLDDVRIMDLHVYLPEIKIIRRPRVRPMTINGYPLEFRVFLGGNADPEGAVSFYYPQAGEFTPTAQHERFMGEAFRAAKHMDRKRRELDLTPWLPGPREPNEKIGCTIDFIVNENNHVIMVDAGPGCGYGAHPCCFIGIPVKGRRWHPAPGVRLE